MMCYVITDAAENCTSCCAKSTGSNYNEVNFFFVSFTADHIAGRLAPFDHPRHLKLGVPPWDYTEYPWGFQ